MRKTKLTDRDYDEFYKTMFYGDLSDPLKAAIKSAYRDLCRTISGFSKKANHDFILSNANRELKIMVQELLSKGVKNQGDFDNWHRKTCTRLIKQFDDQPFTYGQAQKWINMTLKYLSMFDYVMVKSVYEYCHIPVDNYIIEKVGYSFNSAWSKINSYDEYLEFQKVFRLSTKNIPLDEEFYMWINARKEKVREENE
jgi:hypothetical protein